MLSDPASLVDVAAHPAHRLSVPTREHFDPLFYLAGIAAQSGDSVGVLVGGCVLGSLSMTSYVVG